MVSVKQSCLYSSSKHTRGISLLLMCAISIFILQPISAHAETVIRTNARPDSPDQRLRHSGILLDEALNITTAEHGPYTLSPLNTDVSRNRALIELGKGNIEVYSAAARKNWEDQAIAVRIPLHKGLLGYKLLLIQKPNASRFAAITSLDQLKTIPMGGGSQWTSTMAFKALGFHVIGGEQYETLFEMLKRGRFDYFPRGITEIYEEFQLFSPVVGNMIVEPTTAFYLPNPVYFFISPKYPELAERIEKGLNRLLENGRFDQLFQAHHIKNIMQADLKNRQIFYLKNPALSAETPFSRKELWYRPEQL